MVTTEQPPVTTGYEGKPLKVVIENWLYGRTVEDMKAAEWEMARRFSKSFPRPQWATRSKE